MIQCGRAVSWVCNLCIGEQICAASQKMYDRRASSADDYGGKTNIYIYANTERRIPLDLSLSSFAFQIELGKSDML